MLIGLGGFAGSGKDAAADILCDQFGFRRTSFAAALKDEIQVALAAKLIPEGLSQVGQEAFLTCLALDQLDPFVKPTTPEMRLLLQQWGTEFRRAQSVNYWVRKVRNAWYALGRPNTVVTDVRFYNEVDWVKSESGITAVVQRIYRHYETGVLEYMHESERLPYDLNAFDLTIDNTRTLKHLVGEVSRFHEKAYVRLAA